MQLRSAAAKSLERGNNRKLHSIAQHSRNQGSISPSGAGNYRTNAEAQSDFSSRINNDYDKYYYNYKNKNESPGVTPLMRAKKEDSDLPSKSINSSDCEEE